MVCKERREKPLQREREKPEAMEGWRGQEGFHSIGCAKSRCGLQIPPEGIPYISTECEDRVVSQEDIGGGVHTPG